MDNPSIPAPGGFYKRLLEVLKKREHAIAYVIVVLIGIGEQIHIPIVHESAISILGVILLYEFFDLAKDRIRLRGILTGIAADTDEIRRELNKAVKQRIRFNNINEAQKQIQECIQECYQTDNHVEIQWIGMTIYNVGSVLKFVFNDLAKEAVVRELHMKVAMLDGKWVDTYKINKSWDSRRVDAGKENLLDSFRNKQSSGLNWDCTINHYSHMPGIHGGLINGKYLFLGMAQWVDGDMHAGEKQYSLYTDQSQDDQEKIRIFQGWFELCFSGGIHPSLALSAGAPN